MMISTKGRYAVLIMLDLAMRADEDYVSIKSIAERQGISAKYLEMIISLLTRGGVVSSRRGKNGGYALSRPADKISIGEIIRLTEGRLAPVTCLEHDENQCEKARACLCLPMWAKLDNIINNYLDGVSIADVLEGRI